MTMNKKIDISVMFPTRGRPESLGRSLQTLLDRAVDVTRLEILLAIDDDDQPTIDYCINVVKPMLESINCSYTFLQFNRQGYTQLHKYLNKLSAHAKGNWLFFYNDDAVMDTQGWDQIILDNGQEFCLQRAETNHEHPYAIFPILPKKWIELTEHFSQHQLNDAWVSQIGWMLDIVKTIPVMITHERFDLTGENKDDTFTERRIFEGDPSDPRDFNHATMRKQRFHDAVKIGEYLTDECGKSIDWFLGAQAGKHDIWEKMLLLDKKGSMKKYKV